MGNYTKEEIKSFEKKDERISKLAIIKSLIEKCNLEDVYAVNPVLELADKYMQYVNGVLVSGVATNDKLIDWVQVAVELGYAKPTTQNVKILDSLWSEYKNLQGANLNKSKLLVFIINRFETYPTNPDSIKVILKALQN